MSERITSCHHDGLTFDVLDEGPLDGEPGGAAARLPRARHHLAATSRRCCTRPGCARSRPTSAATRRAPGRAAAATTGCAASSATSSRWSTQVGAAGPPGRPRLGRRASAGRSAAPRPDLVRTLTAVSVPHPAAFARAMKTSSQRRAVAGTWRFFQLPLAARAERPPGRRPLRPELRKAGMTADDVARFRREIVDVRRAAARAGLVPRAPAARAGRDRPQGAPCRRRWCGATATSRSAARGAEAHRGAGWTRRTELVVLEGVSHWIPTQAPDGCAAAILERVLASEVGA